MSRNASVHWDTAKGAWRTDAGGKTHYFRGIAKNNKAEAKLAFEAYLRDIGARYVRTSDPTVEQLAELYLQHSKRHARPRTLEGHVEMLRAFALFPDEDSPSRYGLRRARTIRGADLVAMERAWAERGLSPHYRADSSGASRPAGPGPRKEIPPCSRRTHSRMCQGSSSRIPEKGVCLRRSSGRSCAGAGATRNKPPRSQAASRG